METFVFLPQAGLHNSYKDYTVVYIPVKYIACFFQELM